jgi:hypothetical protein
MFKPLDNAEGRHPPFYEGSIMTVLIVKHRTDGLLQRTTSQPREEGESNHFTKHSLPAHQALMQFIDERLSQRSFKSIEELEKALEEWQSFYYGVHQSAPSHGWDQLYVNHLRGVLAARTNGHGGDFVFAILARAQEASAVVITPAAIEAPA